MIFLTGFLYFTRQANQAKIENARLAYIAHPEVSETYKLSPENIGFIKKKFIGENIRGYHYIPNEIRHKGVVITFGGSDGGTFENIANYISSDGYEVIAVYYFGQNGQPESVERIPLEIYEEIYSYINVNCIDSDIITIVGASKGSELALLLSTYYDTIDNVVLFAPVSYVSPSTYNSNKSSWTYDGKDIPYLNGKVGNIENFYRIINIFLDKPLKHIRLQNSVVKSSTNQDNARIKVENSNAKILIFYGEDDMVSDVKLSSRVIKEHAKNEIIIQGYENVGHGVGGSYIENVIDRNIVFGGDIDSNIEAELDSKKKLLETLNLWHE